MALPTPAFAAITLTGPIAGPGVFAVDVDGNVTVNDLTIEGTTSGGSFLPVSGGTLTGGLQFAATRVWSGDNLATNPWVSQQTTWTGANGGTQPIIPNYHLMIDETNSGTFGAFLFRMQQDIGTTSKVGDGVTLDIITELNSPTGNLTGGGYIPARFTMFANSNDNGTALAPAGGAFGLNVAVNVGGTYWSAACGVEIDVGVQSSALAIPLKIGQQIVLLANDAIAGTQDDVAFSLNNQAAPSSSYGWTTGIEFGRNGGQFPIRTSGTMIGAQGFGGASGQVVGRGIDWRNVDFTGLGGGAGWIIQTVPYSVDGTGKVFSSAESIQSPTNANGLFLAGANTGGPPTISVIGSDTNVSMQFGVKGTGSFLFTASGTELLEVLNVASAISNLNLAAAAAANNVLIDVGGTATGITIGGSTATGVAVGKSGGALSFFGGSTVAKPTVAGSKAGNAALASLMTALSSLGLVTDTTT